MTKEGESQGWIDSELLTTNKTINPESAKRNTVKLLKGLSELGLFITDPGEPKIANIPPLKTLREIKKEANDAQYIMEAQESTIDIPHPSTDASKGELISDYTREILFRSAYSVTADVFFDNQPFELYMLTQPEGVMPYYLNLTMRTALRSNKEMVLGSLPSNFTSAGFAYDLNRNPQYRNRLSSIAQKRVPTEIVDNDPSRKSVVDGRDTPEGINTVIRLYLQDPDPQNFLKCYETERFPEGNSRKDDAEEYVKVFIPEANWQKRENHNCLIPRKSDNTYPLIPSANLDKVSILIMKISYRGNTPQVVHDLLGDLPLSIDSTNQWYASESDRSKNGYMQLLFKPEWGENNAAFVYSRSSQQRISPEHIYNAATEMNTLKNNLKERLIV